MKKIRKLSIYLAIAATMFSMVFCANRTKKTENSLMLFSSAGETNISDPVNGYYKMLADLPLPLVTKIPNYKNQDSLKAFLQNEADSFSWRTFIAINWPANDNGSPDSTKSFGSETNYTVFEHWMPATNLYVDSGQSVKPWNFGIGENAQPLNSGQITDFRIIPKFESINKTDADNLPVIDVNGKYTLFIIYYNKQAYDYMVKGELYSKRGQQNFVKTWPSLTEGLKVTIGGQPIGIEKNFKRAYFSVGTTKDSTIVKHDTTFYFTQNPGTVLLKSGWRMMMPDDDKARYYTKKVTIKSGKEIEIGLVAIHIAHKVSEATQWVWSTFEHIDNAPEIAEDGTAIVDNNVHYGYFNKTNNDPSKYNVPSDSTLFFDGTQRTPTQIVRANNIETSTEKINNYYRANIRKYSPESVWQYYKLVGTQWPFSFDLFTAGGDYTPPVLANTVLETYMQKTSSCMDCHSQARFLHNDPATSGMGYNADFVWGLANVK